MVVGQVPWGFAARLLLVADYVLEAGNDGLLQTKDGLVGQHACEVRIVACRFPISTIVGSLSVSALYKASNGRKGFVSPSALCHATEWSNGRTKRHVGSFGLELPPHVQGPVVRQLSVPGGADVQSGGVRIRTFGASHSVACIAHAKPREPKPGNATALSDAAVEGVLVSDGHVFLLLHRHLGHQLFGLGVCIIPVTQPGALGYIDAC